MQVQKAEKSTDLIDETGGKFVLGKPTIIKDEEGELMRKRTGSIIISRLPQPCLSGREGCAPIRTLFSFARRTVSFMMEKSLNQCRMR